jgi:hypothetical protein
MPPQDAREYRDETMSPPATEGTEVAGITGAQEPTR